LYARNYFLRVFKPKQGRKRRTVNFLNVGQNSVFAKYRVNELCVMAAYGDEGFMICTDEGIVQRNSLGYMRKGIIAWNY
jgi:hypothetical protein